MTNVFENNNPTWKDKIQLYKDVFWESPWNEWFICKNCNKLYPAKFTWNCDCSNPNLEDFYKDEELKESFRLQSMKTCYMEYIADVLWEKSWFMWWWKSNMEEINEEKLGLDEEEMEKLKQWILEKFPNFYFDSFFYLSEMGIKKEFRWQGIASKMYDEIKRELVLNTPGRYILIRTTKKSNVPYKWLQKIWYEKVYDYNDQQDRAILVYAIY